MLRQNTDRSEQAVQRTFFASCAGLIADLGLILKYDVLYRIFMYEESITRYLMSHDYEQICLKTVLFDMDGVLFNSMAYHAEAWDTVMHRHGLDLSREEAYLHEGRTGMSTINLVYRRQFGCDASADLIDSIYKEKCDAFAAFPEPAPMPGAYPLLQKIKADNILPVLVTGSGQHTLFHRLDHFFPGMFTHEYMVTAYDVKHGKPAPEPYLMGLSKAGADPFQAIVVENAPLGVQAGVAAGVFTVAVNTGPLPDKVLLDAGANLLFPSMQALCDNWEELYAAFKCVALPDVH